MNSLPLENNTEKLHFFPEWNSYYEGKKEFLKGVNANIPLWQNTCIFLKSHVSSSPDTLVRFFTSFKQTFISENQVTKVFLSPHLILLTMFLRSISLTLASTPCRRTHRAPHLIHLQIKLSVFLQHGHIPREAQMASLDQIALLHSYVHQYLDNTLLKNICLNTVATATWRLHSPGRVLFQVHLISH